MELLDKSVKKIFSEYPEIENYFVQLGLPVISVEMTLKDFFSSISDRWLRDLGVTEETICTVIKNIITESKSVKNQHEIDISSITILGGFDKDGNKEELELTVNKGECYGITGVTGSGKSRFLEDIEYISCGDSPSKRKILINHQIPEEAQRIFLENHLCASLSQSMNFVMELTCKEFIRLHALCRKGTLTEQQILKLIQKVISCANSLCGEQIFMDSIITQLSGGQSRALMISDIALVSDSPIVLIDEPENAGVDKEAILNLLAANGKIVFISTHDPVIALSCKKRICIKNGAVKSIIERSVEEEKLLYKLKSQDRELVQIRNLLRNGEYVC